MQISLPTPQPQPPATLTPEQQAHRDYLNHLAMLDRVINALRSIP